VVEKNRQSERLNLQSVFLAAGALRGSGILTTRRAKIKKNDDGTPLLEKINIERRKSGGTIEDFKRLGDKSGATSWKNVGSNFGGEEISRLMWKSSRRHHREKKKNPPKVEGKVVPRSWGLRSSQKEKFRNKKTWFVVKRQKCRDQGGVLLLAFFAPQKEARRAERLAVH